MPEKRISKSSVDALRCPDGKDRVFLWDKDLKGFGVVAMPSGAKTYVVQFRQGKKSRRMKIGLHGRLTPDEARSEAKITLGQVEQGKDPIEERRAKRAEESFGWLADKFMVEYAPINCKPRTVEEYGRMLRLHIKPAIGSKAISNVTTADLVRLHTRMADRPSAANRCLALVDTVWNWGVDIKEIPDRPSPTKGIKPYEERGRERYLTLPELARLGQVLRLAETSGLPWEVDEGGPKAKHIPKPENRSRLIDPYGVAAIRLLIFTGARLREILHARWNWIDWDRGIMFLPDSKTSRKPLYLSQAALQILEGIERIEGNPYVIPGDKPKNPRADLKRPWGAIRKAAGLEGEDDGGGDTAARGNKAKLGKRSLDGRPAVRLHDLRHSFASVGVGSSLGLPLVGKLLGHKKASTTNRYAHLDADPLHKANNLIGAQIVAALEGPKTENG